MKRLLIGCSGLILILGGTWYGYTNFSSPSNNGKASTRTLTAEEIKNIESVTTGDSVADFDILSGAPLLKSKFGVANNIAADGLLESVTADYLDELGPGLFCTQVAFDDNLRDDREEVNSAYSIKSGTLVTTPTTWLHDFETAIANRNMSLLVQLGGAPAPYQPLKITKPAAHPAPTDAPEFKDSAKLIGEWTAEKNHVGSLIWSVWHEPEHTIAGVMRSKNIAGDYIPPYSKDNPEPKNTYDARELAAQTGSVTTLDSIYRAYYAAMKPTLSAFSSYGLAGFLNASFDPDKVLLATSRHPAETYFKAFIDEHTARNTMPVPIQFISFDSYNGHWQEIVRGSRIALKTRTDIGPLIFNEYAPSNMKFEEDGQKTATSTPLPENATLREKKAAKGKDANPTTLDAATAMLSDMAGIIEQPDIAHFCMSYWTGGEDGILNSDKKSGEIAPTVRYTALKLYSELPVAHAALTGAKFTPVGTPGLHGLAGVDFGRAGILLWNDGENTVTTSLQLKNLPTNITDSGVVASLQTITSDTDTIPTLSTYTGQPLTLPAHSIMLVTIKNTDAPALLDRRHSLGEPTQFLATMPMINRGETSCSSTGCTLPALHYAAYDAVRSTAYLGTVRGGKEAHTSVTYQNLPTTIYANVMHYNRPVNTGDITITATVAGCSAALQFNTLTNRTTQTIDFTALDRMCGFATKAKPITLTFTLKGTNEIQAELYLSASKSEADSLAANIFRYNMLHHPL